MDSKTYWTLVKDEAADQRQQARARITQFQRSGNVADLQGQPESDEYIVICSVGSRTNEIRSGVLVDATIRNAAICIVNGTHRLATSEEVARQAEAETLKRRTYAQVNAAKRAAREASGQNLPGGM